MPIMMVLFEFTPKYGVHLSNTILFLGAFTSFIVDFNTSHPQKKATLIDYGIVIIMLPSLMIGSFVGIQIHIVIPQMLILFLLTFLMIFVSWKSTQQGLNLYREELEERKNHPSSDQLIESDSDSEERNEIELLNIEFSNSWIDSLAINNDDSMNTITLK